MQCTVLSKKLQLSRKDFYFIRHGETDVNANPNIKRVNYDLPLNHRGEQQARLAREAVSKLCLKSVCYSPIQRAVQTKDILIEGLELLQVEEHNLSECKANLWNKMVALGNKKGLSICEEVSLFFIRVIKGLDTALTLQDPSLIVAHGGIHWALCYLFNIDSHPWKIGNCELVHFLPKGPSEWKAKIVIPKQI